MEHSLELGLAEATGRQGTKKTRPYPMGERIDFAGEVCRKGGLSMAVDSHLAVLAALLSHHWLVSGLFHVELVDSIAYAGVPVHYTVNGQTRCQGYIPTIISKCGWYLKEKGLWICSIGAAQLPCEN